MRLLLFISLSLGLIEAAAYWWMHPTPTGQDQPVLTYQPGSSSSSLETPSSETPASSSSSSSSSSETPSSETPASSSSSPETPSFETPASSSSSETPASSSTSSPISASQDFSVSAFTERTALPEIYSQSAPMLRCTGGNVWHVQQSETIGAHLAYFEWDGTDTGSVLEAFRHAPEACMGSIGMKLISHEKPMSYQVGDQTLVFEHTIFQEPGTSSGFAGFAPQVHAFRAVWVAGKSGENYRKGVDGKTLDQLSAIRIKSALKRYRPSHARVIQGAVRGAATGDAAWKAFEQAMLVDLVMTNP